MRRKYQLGDTLSPEELTEYALRHKLRSNWGILDEDEIKQTISYFGEYWKLEEIDISDFPFVCDPEYNNKSMKAHPIVHYFNQDEEGRPYCEILDGCNRIGMAKARGETTILAWVAHDPEFET